MGVHWELLSDFGFEAVAAFGMLGLPGGGADLVMPLGKVDFVELNLQFGSVLIMNPES